MVHGGRDRADSFRATAAHLGDLSVVLYDRRGYGESAGADGPISLDDHVEDLVAVIGDGQATVVGHSWGGHVALAAAIRRPELVRAVGVFETAWLWTEWWEPRSKDAIRSFAARGWPGATPRELARMREEVAMIDRAAYEVAALTVPCVVGYGTESRPAETAASYRRAAELIGAEVVVLDGTHHNAHRSYPEAFAGFVRRAVALGDGR
jgi:pimeloyl-ACP methyl ester carboxylesterase